MKITLLLLLSLITFSAFAQDNQPPPEHLSESFDDRLLHFGLNFTPGVYWVNSNSANDKSNGASLGYGYGANLEFYFTPNYAFLFGMNITNITAHYINDNPNPSPNTLDSTITHSEQLQYLQLPLELKLNTVPFGRIRYFGVVGLNFGFLLKATDSYTYTNTYVGQRLPLYNLSYSGTGDISDQTDFFRVSFVIGGGLEYELAGSTALQASLTYNSCFTNMNNTSSNNVNIKGIELMLGVLF
jgi:hypothetical protein